VLLGGERLTYEELERASNRLAWLLKEAGCRPGDRVCMFLRKSPSAVASMLGVLKADCVYVPIDLASPAARVEKIVLAADPRFILADRTASKLLDGLFAREAVPAVPVGWVEGSGRRSPRAVRVHRLGADALVLSAHHTDVHGQVRVVKQDDFPALRRLLWCGEVLPTPTLPVRGATASRSRSARRATARSSWSSTRSFGPARSARSVTCTSAAWG
jgi:acyl-CoA synthetase (AMP-forming)/AMP-acid ligase II